MSTPTISSPAQAFIDGAFADAQTGETFDTYAPSTGRVLACVAACGPADVDRAVTSARAAFDRGGWRRMAPAERKRVLLRLAELVEANAQELARLDAIDAGKPIVDCEDLDLPDVVNTLRWYAEAIDKAFGKISPTGENNLALILREPVGVVAAVLPWNFPAAMLAWKIAPALASGNSVIVKPPEQAPLSTLRIAELAAEAGLPEGVFNVVPGHGTVAGRALGLHMDVDVAAFTGSTEVGREFLRYSADSNLKRVVLECGGKSPQIVMADGLRDLGYVADQLASAAFWNMGENCTCGSRTRRVRRRLRQRGRRRQDRQRLDVWPRRVRVHARPRPRPPPRPRGPRRDRGGQLLRRGRHQHPVRRLQAVRFRRPRQGPRGARPVHRAQDGVVRATERHPDLSSSHAFNFLVLSAASGPLHRRQGAVVVPKPETQSIARGPRGRILTREIEIPAAAPAGAA